MRFFLILAALIALGVFGFQKCSARFIPDKGKGEKTSAEGGGGGMMSSLLPSKAKDSGDDEDAPPMVLVYEFKNRPVPDFEALSRSSKGGEVGLFVDKLTNTVMFRGSETEVVRMFMAMPELDKLGDEGFVDASLLFVRGDRVRDFEMGLKYRDGLEVTGSISLSPGGFGVVLPAGAVSFTLDYLAENGTLEVLDRPQVRIASGETSVVSTGEDVPVPVTTFDNGLARSSIEFRKVGLMFSVQPFFLADGRARLSIAAENGLVGESRRVGEAEVPQISTQKVSSVVTLGTDEGILVGGLETIRRSRRFGLFGDKETAETGRLYLCLVLRSGMPKAIPLDAAGRAVSEQWRIAPTLPPPAKVKRGFLGLFGRDDPPEDGMVLPPKDWEREERDFIRAKAAK